MPYTHFDDELDGPYEKPRSFVAEVFTAIVALGAVVAFAVLLIVQSHGG